MQKCSCYRTISEEIYESIIVLIIFCTKIERPANPAISQSVNQLVVVLGGLPAPQEMRC